MKKEKLAISRNEKVRKNVSIYMPVSGYTCIYRCMLENFVSSYSCIYECVREREKGHTHITRACYLAYITLNDYKSDKIFLVEE